MKLEASGTADPDRIRILEVEQYRKDGSIVLMENHLSFMRDEAKKPVGIISVSHDITERKRAEEALNKAKTLLDKTFASMEEAIFIIDSNTRRIIACNHATEVIFGFGEKDLIGCSTDVLHVDKLSYDLFGFFFFFFFFFRKLLSCSGSRWSVSCRISNETKRRKCLSHREYGNRNSR